jgi:hypothetical protein
MKAPFVPADVDLRGLPWMRLDTQRLLDSDMFALSTGDEFKFAVALWCKSWSQTPAASLPNDDRILAHLSGAGARWKKVKAMALRGWILCDDGRLYHPVVAEMAMQAWEERQDFRSRQEAAADRKRREREERARLFAILKACGHAAAWNTSTAELRDMARQVTDLSRVTGGDTSLGQAGAGHAPDTAKKGWDGTGWDGNLQGSVGSSVQEPGTEVLGEGFPARTPTHVEAAVAMRRAGVLDAHGEYAPLHAFLAEGGRIDALAEIAAQAAKNGQGRMAYVVAKARGQLSDAKRVPRASTKAGQQAALEQSNLEAASSWAANAEEVHAAQ